MVIYSENDGRIIVVWHPGKNGAAAKPLPFIIIADGSDYGITSFQEYVIVQGTARTDSVLFAVTDRNPDRMVEAQRIVGELPVSAEFYAPVLHLETGLSAFISRELTRIEIICAQKEILEPA